jgi:hypothetical protein
MAESLAELQASLITVNTAIGKLIAGEQLTQLKIGIGPASTLYQFSEITLENLNKEKTRILKLIAGLSAEIVTFRASSRMQTVHRKV